MQHRTFPRKTKPVPVKSPAVMPPTEPKQYVSIAGCSPEGMRTATSESIREVAYRMYRDQGFSSSPLPTLRAERIPSQYAVDEPFVEGLKKAVPLKPFLVEIEIPML